MDYNTLELRKRKEDWEVFQDPHKQVRTKKPGGLAGNRWQYRDNPWNGIGEKEYRSKLEIWSNTTPWEHPDSPDFGV